MSIKIAIILSGGSGSRFSRIMPKQYWFIDREIVLRRILHTFYMTHCFDYIICVVNEKYHQLSSMIASSISNYIHIITGGLTRQDSSHNAIKYLRQVIQQDSLDTSIVAIHDAARYLCTKELIQSSLENLDEHYDGVAPCIPTPDSTIIDGKYINRDRIKLIQTPQIFKFYPLYDSHNRSSNMSFTDDASMLQYHGYKIKFIPGDINNIKLTHYNNN